MVYDIAIIGGGPAGATLARLLGKKMSTLVIDMKHAGESSFRKTCGGLLSGDAQKALSHFDLSLPKDVLVDPQIFAVKTIDLATNMSRYYQRFYINLDRHLFDLWLLSLLPKEVTLYNGRAQTIREKDGMFEISCQHSDSTLASSADEVFFARKIVGADGANSLVRRTFFPNHHIRQYLAIQQWFADDLARPLYSCIFDPATSDCCSWSISKNQYTIFGGAFPLHHSRQRFEQQKSKLAAFGLQLNQAEHTEACLVLRPKSAREIITGRDNIYLLGEAAGLISPSSLEGISWALDSAWRLSEVLLSSKEHTAAAYRKAIAPLRLKIAAKVCKSPFMYQPTLRKLVMCSRLKTIDVMDSKNKA